jgi:hypothetical protein
MFRLATLLALQLALLFAANEPTRAGQYGTPEEAKAMLERAVAAVNEDKANALDTFNKGEGGFEDRDLYVTCANASDGLVTAHPYLKGEHLQDIKGKKDYPLRDNAEGHRGHDKGGYLLVAAPRLRHPLEKTTFYTKVGDQICSVGYYKD